MQVFFLELRRLKCEQNLFFLQKFYPHHYYLWSKLFSPISISPLSMPRKAKQMASQPSTTTNTYDTPPLASCQSIKKKLKRGKAKSCLSAPDIKAHDYLLVPPSWMPVKDLYIHRGYRTPRSPQISVVQYCFASLCSLHNETVNIWSHLGMAIFMLGLLWWSYIVPAQQHELLLLHSYQEINGFFSADLTVVRGYLVGILGCLVFSVSAYLLTRVLFCSSLRIIFLPIFMPDQESRNMITATSVAS